MVTISRKDEMCRNHPARKFRDVTTDDYSRIGVVNYSDTQVFRIMVVRRTNGNVMHIFVYDRNQPDAMQQ